MDVVVVPAVAEDGRPELWVRETRGEDEVAEVLEVDVRGPSTMDGSRVGRTDVDLSSSTTEEMAASKSRSPVRARAIGEPGVPGPVPRRPARAKKAVPSRPSTPAGSVSSGATDTFMRCSPHRKDR